MSSTGRTNPPRVPGKSKDLDFKDIVAKLAAWKFPDAIDGVVAIAQDGIVPGALVAQRLGTGLKTITISYRDDFNEPQFAQPHLVSSVPGLSGWRRVLLVDDVWLSGSTWNAAREHLPRSVEILPFVLAGDVDCALLRGIKGPVHWPWLA